jgi:predicted PolB exonuclease-like 3'-5' exonuclease
VGEVVARSKATVVTWHGRGFDLPVLMARAMVRGVPMPWYFDERDYRYRYSIDKHLDLGDQLADYGAARGGKLGAVAKAIGLPGKIGIGGEHVEAAYKDGRLVEIHNYCLCDVALTGFIFLRYMLLRGKLKEDAYRTSAGTLYELCLADKRVAEVASKADAKLLLLDEKP